MSIYNSTVIGFSWDEVFHHVNGLLRFNYLISLGDFQNFNYANNRYYPGLYDTISFAIGHVVEKIDVNFYQNYISEIKHLINLFFSILSLLGFFLIVNIFFNKDVSLIAVLLTLLNPFFFGHMSINPKDIIIFFSLIWFCYFFYKYLFYEKKKYINLISAAFFAGLGCGVRISFVALLFPIFIIGTICFFKKSKNYLISLKQFVVHITFAIAIIVILTIVAWPHVLSNSFSLLLETVKNSISWSAGPKLGLINGLFYETANTSSLYFLKMIKYKMPFFLSLLFFLSYFLVIIKKNFFAQVTENFNIKFIIINVLIIFPIIISIIFSVKIYDYLRLFIFIMPFLGILASLSLYYYIVNCHKSFYNKFVIVVLIFLFSIFFYRFIILSPYQYTYVNFYYPKLKNSYNKFEHDYWGTSFKELVIKIKNNFPSSEISNFKFSLCGGDSDALLYYLKKYLNINKIYNYDMSTHIIMTNRASFNVNDKTTCFKKYKGNDLVTITRDDLILSTMRKN